MSFGILISFVGLFTLLFGALSILRRLDHAWILVRRAAGHDQRTGALARIFGATAVVCALAFLLWFLVIHGPGAGLAGPGRIKSVSAVRALVHLARRATLGNRC